MKGKGKLQGPTSKLQRNIKVQTPNIKETSNAFFPMMIAPSGVKHSGNSDCSICFVNFVNHAIGKFFRITPTNVFRGMTTTIEQRIDGEGIPSANDFFYKERTESGLAGFIPGCGFRNVVLNGWGEFHSPLHLRRARTLAFISSKVTAEAGASRKAANLDSTKASSSAESWGHQVPEHDG